MTSSSSDRPGLPQWKVDIHTHLLPRAWPTFEGVDLQLTHFKDAPDRFGDKIPFEKPTGFVAQMEWRSSGALFRKCRANLFDPEEVLRDCDSSGVDLQVACTVPVMFNYQLEPTIGMEWSRFLNQDLGKFPAVSLVGSLV
ncbi:unnamed protein product [Amoebophrya sp. A25]|nr:unnamed protein product [Amoebophrya sp. A25]|eukprot:GSA25T00024493001.1